ncbi:hypothetical protein AX768_13395 [Burkholderia sp. PAMC 28687]|uniref:hypothetical protein n=1 Tax=Burkholderia sp. PAMC 28687 TaxID=1795874 RepID=UPI000780FBA7|nr:hypothetical protein [Burkholderia sp. PAMC 28687]AMM14944.1 hypothetical protein AX768_13395 [Burkholderia sp. PAMC 28687]
MDGDKREYKVMHRGRTPFDLSNIRRPPARKLTVKEREALNRSRWDVAKIIANTVRNGSEDTP